MPLVVTAGRADAGPWRERSEGAQTHVLVLDEDPQTLGSVKRCLCEHGFAVDTAASGELALRLFNRKFYGVVVIDLELRSLDGMELLCRFHERSPDTVFVAACSALDTEIERLPGPNRRLVFALAKPYDTAELMSVMDEARELAAYAAWARTRKTRALVLTGGSESSLPMIVESALGAAPTMRSTLAEGLAELNSHVYGLVVSELELPDAAGLEAVRAIRRAAPSCALVVWTRRGDELTCEQAVLLGAQDCLTDAALASSGVALRLRQAALRHSREMAFLRDATHDSLTGLVNATELRARVLHLAARARRRTTSFALIYLDLDGFKEINDRYGHAAGDFLLCWVADGLRDNLREEDCAARVGGDEFALLIEDAYDRGTVSQVAERVISALSAPVRLPSGTEIRVSASLGIAMCPEVAETADALFDAADHAMFDAKAAGAGLFGFAGAECRMLAMPRARLVQELRGAVAAQRLSLEFQPQLNMRAARVSGLEALLRWKRGGGVGPDKFIPLLEDLGLIGEVGEWVLGCACRHAKEWHARGRLIRIAVNVSPLQLEDRDFPETVVRVLQSHDFAPEHLELEVTESSMLRDAALAGAAIARLRELGIRVVLDDFGSGYASFSYLHRFRFDGLKIDRTLVATVHTDPRAATLVRAIIDLAHALTLDVTAEGVEHAEQVSVLRRMGCDECQGFLFGRPHFASVFPPSDGAATAPEARTS